MKKYIKFIFLAMICLTLASCMDISLSYDIDKKGNITQTGTMLFDNSLIESETNSSIDEYLEEMKEELATNHPSLVMDIIHDGNKSGLSLRGESFYEPAIVKSGNTITLTIPAVEDVAVAQQQTEQEAWETFQLTASMAVGALLIDRKATKLEIRCPQLSREQLTTLADSILQAARIKFTKTEYISCPGCGRTLYNLQDTIRRIKAATNHLVGLKIGIMGCIVNGPGEMADADYGYVGAARGKISLYRGKVCVEKNIPEEEAVDRLLQLIAEDNK